jgi:hypothetical protein
MSYLRFQHVFVGLMGLSAASAFVVPPRYSARFQPQIQSLFAPISRPVWRAAAWASTRLSPDINDPRATRDIREENQRLRAELSRLQTQLDELNRRDLAMGELGQKRDLCRLAKVLGADAGNRESLAIAGSTFDGLKEEQYVLCPGGLVGQIQRAGAAGAQVRLITDPAFHVRVLFRRFVPGSNPPKYVDLGVPISLAEGVGRGMMVVRALSLSAIGLARDLRPLGGQSEPLLNPGDAAVLADPDCPQSLKGEMVGRVVFITRRPDAQLFAEIRLQPDVNLKKLHEVMVMTKDQ